MQFASPLGVGFTGRNEPVDITFSPPLPLDELAERIRAKLPPGAAIHGIEEVPLKTESLQSVLIGADYTLIIYAEPSELAVDDLTERIGRLLAAESMPRERQRKGRKYVYNLRPLIFELTYQGYDAQAEEHRIFLRVQQREGATGRPDEVVDALGLDDYARTLRRDRLYFSNVEEDVATFAAYPVVTKESVLISAEPRRRKARRGRDRQRSKPKDEGRTISERAGDEFG